MKTLKWTWLSLALVLTLAVAMAAPLAALAYGPPVGLGTTEHFAVLSGLGISNTGPTVIDGNAGNDVGLHPGMLSAITGFPGNVTMTGGQLYAGDQNPGAALQAKNDLVTAYNDAAGRTPATSIVGNELANTTLTSGVYSAGSGVLYLSSGTLTLDAQGDPNAVFVFQASSGLTIASGTRVSLINGARYCRVFWVVPSDATLETGSHFVGHLFAMNSIFVRTGATIQGQLLARNGSVVLDTNTITNGLCPTLSPTPPTITKSARDINGGKLLAGDVIEWTINVTNTGAFPATGTVVFDTVPAHTTYVAGSITGRGADDSNAPNLRWEVGTLAVGEHVVLRFRSKVPAGLASGTEIRNRAGVQTNTSVLRYSRYASLEVGRSSLLRTGVDDRVWLGAAALLLLAAGALLARDKRRQRHA
jgi:uncharacterized repeat protein (TIGR01451 family)